MTKPFTIPELEKIIGNSDHTELYIVQDVVVGDFEKYTLDEIRKFYALIIERQVIISSGL